MAIRDNLGGGSSGAGSGAVLDTLEEISANTESGKAAGALAVKELSNSLEDILENLQWFIDNGYLPDKNLIAIVPKMTSETSPSGVVSKSTEGNGNLAYYVFDSNKTNYWQSSTSTNQWIAYQSTTPYICKRVSMTQQYINGSYRAKNFKVQGCNDGSNWKDIYVGVLGQSVEEQTFTFANETPYLHHRLLVIDYYGSGESIMLNSLQFYGKPS